jgi:hypothetical protein
MNKFVVFSYIIHHRSISMAYNDGIIRSFVKVDYTGTVSLYTTSIFISMCNFDVTQLPFDMQVCNLQFASPTFDTEKVYLYTNDSNVDLRDSYMPNQEFNLTSITASAELVNDNSSSQGENQTFSQVTYRLTLERRSSFYITTYVIPSILIILLGEHQMNSVIIAFHI